jgi:hypothetical protein
VRVVGDGTEVRKPTSGPQKPTPMSFPIVRRYADEVGQKLTPQVLQVNGKDKDPRGTGGGLTVRRPGALGQPSSAASVKPRAYSQVT